MALVKALVMPNSTHSYNSFICNRFLSNNKSIRNFTNHIAVEFDQENPIYFLVGLIRLSYKSYNR